MGAWQGAGAGRSPAERAGRQPFGSSGNFSYTTIAGKLAPMFVNHDGAIFAYCGEDCYNGDPFAILDRETHARKTPTVRRGQGGTLPYISSEGL